MAERVSRRRLMQAGLGLGSSLLAGKAIAAAGTSSDPAGEEKPSDPRGLTVSVVQFRSTVDLADNVRRHAEYLGQCARAGARVVVFPEASVTGYFEESIAKATRADLDRAEAAIAAAAKEASVYAIVGSPTRAGEVTFNSALVIAPDGKIIERYHKVHLAGERWAAPGDHLSVFPIDGTLSSIIICHDERYPELVRLPVLAGARIVFYISHESDITAEKKLKPYRAQIVARAVENSVYVAHANAPAEARDPARGSHGQSRLIDPAGELIAEAGIFEEEVLTATFDLRKATGHLANRSLACPFLEEWWREGAAKVKTIPG